MVEDIIKSIRLALHDRATSPLFGTYAISWCVWNYRFFLAIFSGEPVAQKFALIDGLLYDTKIEIWGNAVLFPLITAVLFLLLYPIPSRWIFRSWRSQQKKLIDVRQEIDRDVLLTVEESREIRLKLFSLKNEYESEIQNRDEKINSLEKEVVAAKRTVQKIGEIDDSISDTSDSFSSPEIRDFLVNNSFRLIFNPTRGVTGSKTITFLRDGSIGEGKNSNEYKWDVSSQLLNVFRENGELQNSFRFVSSNRMFLSTDDPNTPAIRGQYIFPE